MIKIANSYTLDAPRENIWPLIFDPASLMNLIPGCEQIEQVSPLEYRGRIQLRLTALVAAYETYVKLIEYEEPHYCHFEGEVNGPTGSIIGTASFKLKKEVDNQTTIEYEGQAMITGLLANLSPRFIEGVTRTLINQGLARLNTCACATGAGKRLQAQTAANPTAD
jgi:carbon monoxide dehydrogenase subunit G